jgi:site-specific DNA-methyltransferase (adenine-specific)
MIIYRNEVVTVHHGDMRDIVPTLEPVDAVITDPPYGQTSLSWDRWPVGWPQVIAAATTSLWCFGTLRTFLTRWSEFDHAGWKLAQDVVWAKHNGSGPTIDRFRRIHEQVAHLYRGLWREIYHQPPRIPATKLRGEIRPGAKDAPHHGAYRGRTWTDPGTRIVTSVICARSEHRRAVHPTQKPTRVLAPLVEYSVPAGGMVLDPFAGSGSVGLTALDHGRRAVLIEADPAICQSIVRRLHDRFDHRSL